MMQQASAGGATNYMCIDHPTIGVVRPAVFLGQGRCTFTQHFLATCPAKLPLTHAIRHTIVPKHESRAPPAPQEFRLPLLDPKS